MGVSNRQFFWDTLYFVVFSICIVIGVKTILNWGHWSLQLEILHEGLERMVDTDHVQVYPWEVVH